jgi:four helix bundle protein
MTWGATSGIGMRNPDGLKITAHALELALLAYECTRNFPESERFGLSSQMRRAAVSVGSNIVEGCGRSTDAQLIQFLGIACGSASELEFQARLAVRLGYGRADDLHRLERLARDQRQMTLGFARWVRRSS